jgi:hypothetical protein
VSRILLAALLLLVAAECLAGEGAIEHDAFKGTFSCGVTLYMLPWTRDGTPLAAGQGEMEITADGNGKLVRGSLTERLADDTHHPSGIDVCNYTLVTGNYSIDQDGNGTTSVRWALRSGPQVHWNSSWASERSSRSLEFNHLLRWEKPILLGKCG